MTEYRRNGLREFYKITGDIVIRVTNKDKFSRIDVSDNGLIREDARDSLTKESTELEFNDQYNYALERIKTGKIA
jgi:hypothetical protein